ncbi:MAG TPA: TIGR01459 family HAD-type hydrolase [Acetobacteraceae bacterium]|nr:TIGR01459 family HAD-type hydrolase [Acetobacteraceae bacterium]
MEHLQGFAPLARRYEGFVLDLWGVIHDGVRAFPHAVDCLERLRAAGKKTLLLSNVPRPNAPVQAMMRRMGIPDELYGALLTSGEAVRAALRDPPDLWWAELGRRVFHLGPLRDRPILDGLDLVLADRPAEADFVLNSGPDDEKDPTDLGAFEDVLQECRRHVLPMICANPDLEVIRGGVRVLCAGALAARYAELGGDVRALGKPDPRIYQPVLARLGVPAERVLAVGDALRTDIAGAVAVGLDACWVLGGLHGAELAGADGAPDPVRAEAAAREARMMPVATIPVFRW